MFGSSLSASALASLAASFRGEALFCYLKKLKSFFSWFLALKIYILSLIESCEISSPMLI